MKDPAFTGLPRNVASPDAGPGLAPRTDIRPTPGRWKTPAFVVLVVLLVTYAWPQHVFTAMQSLRDSHLNDFGRMYYAARQWRAGESMYGSSPVALWENGKQPLRNLNPPHAHLPFLILAPLPEVAVFVLGLASAALAFACCLRLGFIGANRRSWGLVLAAVAVAPLLAPTQAVLGTGQLFAWWLAVPATLAWRDARRGNWDSSGAWLGLLAATKLFAFVFLPFLLLSRRWRAAASFALAAAACTSLGVLVFGWHSYIEWRASLQQATWIGNQLNGSLMGLCGRLLGGTTFHPFRAGPGSTLSYAALWNAPALVRPLWLALSAIVAVVSLRVALRDDVDRAFAVLFLAALLLSPLGSTYYLWLGIGPLIALLARDRRVARSAWLVVPFLVWPTSLIEIAQPHTWATLLFGCASGWLVLGLWWAVAKPVATPPLPALRFH